MFEEDSDLEDSGSDCDGSFEAMGEALIPHEIVRKEWNLGDVRDEALLKQIGDLTECRLEPRPEKKSILVKGESLQAVDKALAKLDAEWLSGTRKSTLPLVFDFECTECEIDVMLQLLPLKELRDRRLVTTLVPSSGRLFKGLGSYYVVVMIKDGNVHPVGQPRALDRSTAVEQNSKLWGDSISKSSQIKPIEGKAPIKANPATIPDHITPFLPPGKTGAISQWVEQSAVQSASDPFVPPAPPATLANVALPHRAQATEPSLPSQPTCREPVSPPKRLARMRRPKGAALEEDLETPQTAEQSVPGSLANAHTLMQSIPNANTISSADTLLPTSPQAATSLVETGGKAGNKTDPFAVNKPELSNNKFPIATPSVKTRASPSQRSQRYKLPEVQPPYMPAGSTSSTINSNNPQCTYAAVSSSKEGHLIDFETSARSVEPLRDKIKTNDGVASRQLRNTMRQRKPSSQIGSGVTGATSNFENVTTQLFEIIRSTRGFVDFRTAIGRLLIDPKSGTGEYKKTRFAITQWPQVFPNKPGVVRLQTSFTDRLTSLASDADFVVDLKLSTGRRMFTDQPCQRKVVYRFTCSTSHKSEDNLFIDVEDTKGDTGKPVIWRAPKLYGALNWHYPKRYWDARLAIHSSSHGSQEQLKAAEVIVNNLRISPSSDESVVELFTHSPSRVLTIQSIQLRRETHHRSTIYPDLLLKLCEVQEFEIELPRPDNNDHCHAHTNSRKQMVRENRFWWEASIASTTAMKLLKENELLEVGEKTTWTVKDIIDAAVVRNMSFLARDIVTRIDSVGYHNKGPKASSAKDPSDTPAASLGFW